MDKFQNLTDHLRQAGPYPCLDLLEAALAGRKYWPGGTIPRALMEDLETALGGEAFEEALRQLTALGILEEEPTSAARAVRLREDAQPAVERLLQNLGWEQRLDLDEDGVTPCTFLEELVSYLRNTGAQIQVLAQEPGFCLLELDGKTYRLLTAFSPYWLALAAEDGEGEREEISVAAFGPFAGRPMGVIDAYFGMEQFREHVTLYDPWAGEKRALCRGSLGVYIDWFYRDRYRRKFLIPADFCQALHDMGLLRYNDEY